jgi:hypothetical protein
MFGTEDEIIEKQTGRLSMVLTDCGLVVEIEIERHFIDKETDTLMRVETTFRKASPSDFHNYSRMVPSIMLPEEK